MKTLLVGINAKYIHTNLAIRSLREYARSRGIGGIALREFTINQRTEQILPELYREQPDVVGFSCYLWNIGMVRRLAAELRQVLPGVFLFLGGPEVSFDPQAQLRAAPADAVVCGEGEEAVSRLLQALADGRTPAGIPGIALRQGDQVVSTPPDGPLELDSIPFPYQEEEDFSNKILYFESSRGCPFSCQYCLSCNDKRVRFLSLPRVYRALDWFLERRVRQVKFVDRTFNCSRQFARSIWEYLQAHDNGVTNFHFEIAAELLDQETIAFLNTVRRGLFQFEIGVQSTNPDTLSAIRRDTRLPLLQTVVGQLKAGGNLHLHLDLIAGLPYEDYASFRRSFNDVYALRPDQLQLGFLKLLKGSGLYDSAGQYGIVCSDFPPYEVLQTSALPYPDLLRLKRVEEMVETYYNSGRFEKTITYLAGLFPDPFSCYEQLAGYYEQNGHHLAAHANVEYYTILYRFFQTLGRGEEERFQWYARFDLYAHEKARKLPDWLAASLEPEYREEIYRFFDSPEQVAAHLPECSGLPTRQILRQAHLEIFPFSPASGAAGRTAVLFHYQRRGLLGNAEWEELGDPAGLFETK